MIDIAVADHAATERPTRRALLGAGVLGAAMALAGSHRAAATTGESSSEPSGYSEADLTSAGFAIALELTARDLYDDAISSGADATVWSVMRDQHESYAQRLAGITGISANTRDEEVYLASAEGFGTDSPGDAAFELENLAAATHIELLGDVDDPDIAAAMASFVSMESRHAMVLALLSGRGDDFDALFLNSATGLSPQG